MRVGHGATDGEDRTHTVVLGTNVVGSSRSKDTSLVVSDTSTVGLLWVCCVQVELGSPHVRTGNRSRPPMPARTSERPLPRMRARYSAMRPSERPLIGFLGSHARARPTAVRRAIRDCGVFKGVRLTHSRPLHYPRPVVPTTSRPSHHTMPIVPPHASSDSYPRTNRKKKKAVLPTDDRDVPPAEGETHSLLPQPVPPTGERLHASTPRTDRTEGDSQHVFTM